MTKNQEKNPWDFARRADGYLKKKKKNLERMP
jgi:hypothetical protein